jgi:hypothetical protein
VSRSPWTALRPGVVQHGEFHSAEHAGGGDCEHCKNHSTLPTVRAARITPADPTLRWLKTKNIRISVNEVVRDVHAPPARVGFQRIVEYRAAF